MMRRMTILVATAALFAAPAQAVPQDSLEAPETGAETRNEDEGGNPRLGLLGLLGLAGLLGLMRREPDIHIDARGGNKAEKDRL